jgi:hypothetical protein
MGSVTSRTPSRLRALARPPLDRRGRAEAGLSLTRTGLLLLLTAAATFAVCVATASALVLHLRSGHAISYRPLLGTRLAATPFARKSPLLEYHGGPIMPSNTNYAIYWAPKGAPAYPSEYQSGVNKYFEDLAHDSGGVQNVDSVATQYGDSAGEFANYDSHFGDLKFGGALLDADPYPKNGCTAAPICFTGAQLEAEITKFVEANKLPHDLKHEYFLLTPPEVEDCAEATACSAGTSIGIYCAYHSFISRPGGSIIYSNDPYVTGNPGCDNGEHPNNKPSDGALQGGLSHEHNESITDPEINAWFDSRGEENGDKCRTFVDATEFGSPLGKAPNGSRYNQVINADLYWYQQEWSNSGKQCKQRLVPELPAVKKLSPKKGHSAGGTPVTITGTSFTGATAVTFGATKALEFKVLSATAIQAVSPPEATGTVDVTVTTLAGTSPPSRRDHFKYAK